MATTTTKPCDDCQMPPTPRIGSVFRNEVCGCSIHGQGSRHAAGAEPAADARVGGRRLNA